MVSAPEKEKITPQEGARTVDETLVARETEVTKELSELDGYLEKIEKEPRREAVTDDQTGQVVLTPAPSQPTTVTLPLTEEQIKRGLHHKIFDSVRWLAEWCLRIAHKAALLGIKIVYPKER